MEDIPAKRKRLKLQCPFCDKLFDVTDLAPGTKILCAECDHAMVVPDKNSTRRIPEALLRKVKEEQERAEKDLSVLDLGSEEPEPEKKDTGREWIDWDALRKKKKS